MNLNSTILVFSVLDVGNLSELMLVIYQNAVVMDEHLVRVLKSRLFCSQSGKHIIIERHGFTVS